MTLATARSDVRRPAEVGAVLGASELGVATARRRTSRVSQAVTLAAVIGPVAGLGSAMATFAVNSICHTFGRRRYEARDESRNNWLVALLVFGEGWHNNHPAFARSARHGLARSEVDVSWLVIRLLEKGRLGSAVRLPAALQVERAQAAGAA